MIFFLSLIIKFSFISPVKLNLGSYSSNFMPSTIFPSNLSNFFQKKIPFITKHYYTNYYTRSQKRTLLRVEKKKKKRRVTKWLSIQFLFFL